MNHHMHNNAEKRMPYLPTHSYTRAQQFWGLKRLNWERNHILNILPGEFVDFWRRRAKSAGNRQKAPKNSPGTAGKILIVGKIN